MLDDARAPGPEWEAPGAEPPLRERARAAAPGLPGPGADIAELRRFLRERFPGAGTRPAERIPTGLAAVDDAVGGLPLRGVSELICGAPSAGGQVLLLRLLERLRRRLRYAVLVDGSDSFDPATTPPTLLEHLLWARCTNARQALRAADLLLRDENFPLVLLDLRWNEPAQFRRIPATAWFRLQRLCTHSGAGLAVFTSRPTVPSARLKIELSRSLPLDAVDEPAELHGVHIEARVQKAQAAYDEGVG